MRKLKVLVLAVDPNVPTSFYRIVRPLSLLENVETRIVEPGEELGWADLCGVDVALAMRPAAWGNNEILKKIKDRGIPLWFDYDDDLFAVPYHHEDWETWVRDEVRHAAIECLKLADVVTVTTPALKESLLEKAPAANIEIIPNAIDDYYFPEPAKAIELQPRIVLWRGMASHNMDLLGVREELGKISQKHRMVFFGMKPWIVQPSLRKDNWTWLPPRFDPFDAFERMRSLNAAVQIVPLKNDQLNRCKSNIAYLEATWFGGSAVVAPKDWSYPGVLQYRRDEEADGFKSLSECVDALFGNTSSRIDQVEKAQEHIRRHYLLSNVNKLRAELLEKHAR